MEEPRIATHTTSPAETDETAELYGRERIVSSPTSFTEHFVPFGAVVTTAFRTRKQSRVSLPTSSSTTRTIASRTILASSFTFITPPYDVDVVIVKSGMSFTETQLIDMLPVSSTGTVKP